MQGIAGQARNDRHTKSPTAEEVYPLADAGNGRGKGFQALAAGATDYCRINYLRKTTQLADNQQIGGGGYEIYAKPAQTLRVIQELQAQTNYVKLLISSFETINFLIHAAKLRTIFQL
ncbi:hypothetical protein AGMMS49965_05430 [Bacteroidia bacterium]|nr:hypothetical protein AGMMS49965_05430 [Bacteroidia bacterium]